MDFGTVNALKRDYLIEFVGVMARILTRHGNRVGAIFYNSHIDRVIPASGGKLQVLRLINDLQNVQKLSRSPFTSLSTLLNAGNNVIRRRSLVFIVSDFISEPGWDVPMRLLTERHEVLSVRLWDPREVDMPDIGMVVIEDAETGEQLFVDTHDKKFRERFTKAAHKREQYITSTFKRVGVDVLSLSTEDDLVKSVLRFANLRRERKAHPAKGF